MSAKAFDALSKSSVVSSNPQTAQSQVNQDDEDIKKLLAIRKRNLIRFGSLAVLAFVVWLFATIAWFTSNKDVGSSGMGVKVGAMPFEVKVSSPYTNSPDYSALLNSHFSYDITHHETGSGVGGIKCLMTDATADPTNPMRGLQPGSHGTVTFQIKPKAVGTYTLHFDIATIGYHAEFNLNDDGALRPDKKKKKTINGEEVPIFYSLADYADMQAKKVFELAAVVSPSPQQQADLANAREDVANCPKAARYLQGHILFFENKNSTTSFYSDLIEPEIGFDRTYTFTADDVDGTIDTARQEQLTVTLYWIWPNTFGQIVLDNGDRNLSERDPAMFSSAQTADPVSEKTPRQELIEYIASHGSLFFDSTNAMFTDTVATDPDTNESTLIETAADKIVASINGLSTNPDNIYPLSNGYNNADQIIGENVQILFAEISAYIP